VHYFLRSVIQTSPASLISIFPSHQCGTATVTTKTLFHFNFPPASSHTKLLDTVHTSAVILVQVDSTLCPNHPLVSLSLCFWCHIHSGMPAVPLHILYTHIKKI